MALNFNNMPTKNPSEGGGVGVLFENGTYLATIKDAKMVPSKTEGAPDYMQVMLQLRNGAATTNVFDNMVESDKPLPMFKLGQLLRALRIDLNGDFNLSDLPKIIVGKQLMVAIKKEKRGDYPEKNVVNAFDDSIFSSVAPAAAPEAAGEMPFTMGAGDTY